VPGRAFGRHLKGISVAHSPLHISCQEVVELVSDYLEQALPADDAALLEQHLNFCDGCVWYVDQVRTTINVVGELRAEDVPEETKAKLMIAFRDWKRG
jgi:predicted anti-sigma-YlaC factor YlaD